MTDILKFPGVEKDPENFVDQHRCVRVYCAKCGIVIPSERLEVIPDTVHCVSCSTVKNHVGFMESTQSKGTASEIILVNGNDEEALRLARRASSDNEFSRR